MNMYNQCFRLGGKSFVFDTMLRESNDSFGVKIDHSPIPFPVVVERIGNTIVLQLRNGEWVMLQCDPYHWYSSNIFSGRKRSYDMVNAVNAYIRNRVCVFPTGATKFSIWFGDEYKTFQLLENDCGWYLSPSDLMLKIIKQKLGLSICDLRDKYYVISWPLCSKDSLLKILDDLNKNDETVFFTNNVLHIGSYQFEIKESRSGKFFLSGDHFYESSGIRDREELVGVLNCLLGKDIAFGGVFPELDSMDEMKAFIKYLIDKKKCMG